MTRLDFPYGRILGSAEEIPELPDARIVLNDEVGHLPDGYWTTAYRVLGVAPEVSRKRDMPQVLVVCTPTDG